MDESELRRMTALFPESPLPWFSLGKMLLADRRHAEAAEAFEKCLSFDPQYAAALMAVADAYVGLGDDARARDALARCEQAALAQGHPTLAGEARERREELDEAI